MPSGGGGGHLVPTMPRPQALLLSGRLAGLYTHIIYIQRWEGVLCLLTCV